MTQVSQLFFLIFFVSHWAKKDYISENNTNMIFLNLNFQRISFEHKLDLVMFGLLQKGDNPRIRPMMTLFTHVSSGLSELICLMA